jgi:hypothetical protein
MFIEAKGTLVSTTERAAAALFREDTRRTTVSPQRFVGGQ